MKAKLFMILLVVLFIVPISGAVNKPRKRPVLLRKHETRKNVLPRIPIDYTIDVSNNDNCLQILFQFPLHESDITVADKNGNIVINEQQTSIYEGKTYNRNNLPCCRHHGRNHIRGRGLTNILFTF